MSKQGTVATIFAVAIIANIVVMTAYASTDTSDWFEPTISAPLEVHHNGTGQTVNPQETKDAAELQGSAL